MGTSCILRGFVLKRKTQKKKKKKEIFHNENNQSLEPTQEHVEFPMFDVFKMQLDKVLISSWLLFPVKGWTWCSFEVSSNIGCSMMLGGTTTAQHNLAMPVCLFAFWIEIHTFIVTDHFS